MLFKIVLMVGAGVFLTGCTGTEDRCNQWSGDQKADDASCFRCFCNTGLNVTAGPEICGMELDYAQAIVDVFDGLKTLFKFFVFGIFNFARFMTLKHL